MIGKGINSFENKVDKSVGYHKNDIFTTENLETKIRTNAQILVRIPNSRQTSTKLFENKLFQVPNSSQEETSFIQTSKFKKFLKCTKSDKILFQMKIMMDLQ